MLNDVAGNKIISAEFWRVLACFYSIFIDFLATFPSR